MDYAGIQNAKEYLGVGLSVKEIKKLSYSILDETLKKHVLEDFLGKIKQLTPIIKNRLTTYKI